MRLQKSVGVYVRMSSWKVTEIMEVKCVCMRVQ